MITQTITLFHYQLLGIINRKLLFASLLVYLVAFLLGRFAAELAIINSEQIALALMADVLRYSLVVVVTISVCHQVSQDYELRQFERLLAMPISRYQYVLAQTLVILFFVAILLLPMLLVLGFAGTAQQALYWSVAVLLELILVGHFALLASLSLERLPLAVMFTLALYLLAKSAPLLDLVFDQSSEFYQEQQGFQLTHQLFTLLQYVLPDMSAFANNNSLFDDAGRLALVQRQLIGVLIYVLFLQAIVLVDFYRKEFNRA